MRKKDKTLTATKHHKDNYRKPATAFAVTQFTLFPKRRLADIFELLFESVYEVSFLQLRNLNKYLYLVKKLRGVTAIELEKICIQVI